MKLEQASSKTSTDTTNRQTGKSEKKNQNTKQAPLFLLAPRSQSLTAVLEVSAVTPAERMYLEHLFGYPGCTMSLLYLQYGTSVWRSDAS